MSAGSKKLFSVSGLGLLAILFMALVLLSNVLLRGMRIDLTQNQLYTVSAGTRNVLSKIDEPINLYFFYSEKAARSVPALRPYATRVIEMLEEFSAYAGGKLKVQVLDPEPFSEQEDTAAQFGLQALPTASGETVYMGLAGTNSIDDEQIIPFFDPAKEPFLEYELARLIYALANPEKAVIAIMTGLPLGGDFNPQTRQQSPAWVIDEQIDSVFEVRDLSPAVTRIDDDVDVLMLVHPKNLSDETLYGIDQFILGGGKALIFVDPFAEIDQPAPDPANPAAAFAASRSSSLKPIFDAWGIEVSESELVGDARYALQVSGRPGAPPSRHLALLGLDADVIDRSDVVTAELTNINLGMSGFITTKEDTSLTITPLLSSSGESGLLPVQRVRFVGDPDSLRDVYNATDEQYTLAARIKGKASSAYADGAPGDGDTDGHLTESASDINVIVVADVDMLADRFWVQVQNFFGQRLITPWADNGDLVINALDNLSGSSDLIGIRSRASFRRPFDKVEQLKRVADERFRQKEQELQDQLTVTEDKLSQLQSGRDDNNPMIMTEEQSAEIARFLDQRVSIRKELRKVRRDLAQDIEALGVRLKAINIGLMPLIISVGALVAVWLRRRKRKTATEAGL